MEGWCQNMEREAEENELPEESEFGKRIKKIRDRINNEQFLDFYSITDYLCAVSSTVVELIRNAVGSAQMLMSQKVQQFFRLCQQSVVSMHDCMKLHDNTR